jgi:predicted dienelactone hydrolase
MREQVLAPLDLLSALDQVASHPLEGLEGMIDVEHAGAIAVEYGGYNALALSGARIDPEHYLAQCATLDDTTEAILSVTSMSRCTAAGEWDEYAAQAGEAITGSEDGLWQPMTDERIRAVMPLTGEGWRLFGTRGLAAADRPTLMMVATDHESYPESALIFEHLGTPEKALVSFAKKGPYVDSSVEARALIGHFVVAFFGYHLQGKSEYRDYYSEGFVAQFDDLAWGVLEGE